MEKLKHQIKNRHNLSIAVEIYSPENPKGLVFIQHGVTGYKEELQIQKMRDVFYANHYHSVVFDSTHSLGESEGSLMNFTATTHLHDMEDVIAWSKAQSFYKEPFITSGHSMGGFSALYYTWKHPEKVMAVAPISTTVSGRYLDESYLKNKNASHVKWKEEGKILKTNNNKTDFLSWNFIEDFSNYNFLDSANEITVPVILIVGDKDSSAPPEHQQELFDILNCPKELHIIENAAHSFLLESERNEMGQYLDQWIKILAVS